jgi:hypothetical protein
LHHILVDYARGHTEETKAKISATKKLASLSLDAGGDLGEPSSEG